MMPALRIAAPHPDVIDTELDGEETVLLHLGSKRYFSLNATGSMIWRALKRGMTAEEMSLELQRRYDVGRERAARSVSALLDALFAQGLVRHASADTAVNRQQR